jgi:hypothetical protein
MAVLNAGDFPIDPYTCSGIQLAQILNRLHDSLLTLHSGTTPPPYAQAGTLWVDTTKAGGAPPILELKMNTGTGDVTLAEFDTAGNTVSVKGASAVGVVEYQGPWDAAANNPTLPPAAPANKGQYWVVSKDGNTVIDGHGGWKVGDWVVSNGVTYDFIDNQKGTGGGGPGIPPDVAAEFLKYLPLAGGTMTGDLKLPATPAGDDSAITKKFMTDTIAAAGAPDDKEIALTAGANVAWDWDAGEEIAFLELDQDCNISLPPTVAKRLTATLRIKQDAAGGHAVVFVSGYNWGVDGQPTMPQAAGDEIVLGFRAVSATDIKSWLVWTSA